jgi:UDPglucose--hexose-1-phosphate uridylyltransferase
MSQLIHDTLHNRTVLISPARRLRPNATGQLGLKNLAQQVEQWSSAVQQDCPFCPGNEAETPLDFEERTTDPWSVRLFPNKYPALNETASAPSATGSHEVLVAAREHLLTVGQLTEPTAITLWQALQRRAMQHRDTGRWRWTSLFQNVGAAAGASLAHLHCQLLALNDVPTLQAQELASGAQFFQTNKSCAWCAELLSARAEQARWVMESDRFVAFCPRAPRLPFETWIMPKQHQSHFELTDLADLADLAKLWGRLFRALEPEIPAYNWWIHTSPFDSVTLKHYHWHIEVLPRVTTTAGFEWSTGWYINPVSAEDAASTLRAALTKLT